MKKQITKEDLAKEVKEYIDEYQNGDISKMERSDFEFFIGNHLNLSFNYKEAQTDSDSWGEVYIGYKLFVDENEKYWSDIYMNMDYDFTQEIDVFIDELWYFETKARDIIKKLEITDLY